MSPYQISVHIDRPERLRLAGSFSEALQEVTLRTKASFGSTIIAYHHGGESHYAIFASVAHRRGPDHQFVQPADPAHRLYDETGKPVLDAMSKFVPGMLIDAAGRRADDHGYFTVTAARWQAVRDYIETSRANPGFYSGIHQNCVRFARTALEIGGIALDTSGLRHSVAQLRRPEDISSALAQQPQRDGTRFIIGQALLLGR